MKVIFFNTINEQFYGIMEYNQICGASVDNGKLINCSKGVQDQYQTADFYPLTLQFNDENIQIARIKTNKQLFVINDDTISDNLPDISDLYEFIQDKNPVLIITNISQLAQKSFKLVIDKIINYKSTVLLLKQAKTQFTFINFKDALLVLSFMNGNNPELTVEPFDNLNQAQVSFALNSAFVENRHTLVQQTHAPQEVYDNITKQNYSQRLQEVTNNFINKELVSLILNQTILKTEVSSQEMKYKKLAKLIAKAHVENFVNLKLFDAGVFIDPLAPNMNHTASASQPRVTFPKIQTGAAQMKEVLQGVKK